MKTILITAIFMSLCLGVSHSLKANNATDTRVAVASMVSVEQLSEGFGINNQTTQGQLKQELSQSIGSLTLGVKQTATAIVDVAMGTVRYVFLSITQVLASLVFDR